MASRKLVSEIERTLKKIQEGNANFDEIWERVHSAKKPNAKEKLEAELKKEIKRLQRYRDSVKTWAGQDVIKQKQPLIEARKEIEVRMEQVWRFFQYKRSERQGMQAGEMKTKSWSKESSGKGKLEQLTLEQEEAMDWIGKQQETLKTQLADLIEQQERLVGGSRKRKKNRDRDDEELYVEKRIEQHEFHIKKMKMLKEVIVERKVKPSVIESVREAVEYYVTDAIQDPQFMDDDYLYEPVHEAIENEDNELEEEVEESPAPPVPEKKSDKRLSKKNRKKDKKKKSIIPSTPIDGKRNLQRAPPNVSSAMTPNKSRASAMDTGRISENIISFVGPKKPAPSPAPSSEINAPSFSGGLRQSLENKMKSPNTKPQSSLPPSAGSPEPSRSEAASATSGTTIFRTPPAQCEIPHREALPSLSLAQQSQSGHSSQAPAKKGTSLADIIADELAKTQNSSNNPSSLPRSGSESSQPKPATPYLSGEGVKKVIPPEQVSHIRSRRQPMLSKHDAVLHHSYQNMIQPCDTYRERTYLPRNPYQTPRFFPEHPDPLLYEPPIFEKFDADTLFFIFYFQQGTYQQYLAACELKKGAWRYHKKYLTWFQRHCEPEETTEEYEKGTYVYFDYDTSWCPRMKKKFVFEYSYLEDELDYVKDKFELKR